MLVDFVTRWPLLAISSSSVALYQNRNNDDIEITNKKGLTLL